MESFPCDDDENIYLKSVPFPKPKHVSDTKKSFFRVIWYVSYLIKMKKWNWDNFYNQDQIYLKNSSMVTKKKYLPLFWNWV